MGNVTQLPKRPVREWLVIEKDLRATLIELGAEPDMITHVCAVLRPLFLKYAADDFHLDAYADPDEAIKGLNRWVHNFTGGLFTQIAIREIELYQLRGVK